MESRVRLADSKENRIIMISQKKADRLTSCSLSLDDECGSGGDRSI